MGDLDFTHHSFTNMILFIISAPTKSEPVASKVITQRASIQRKEIEDKNTASQKQKVTARNVMGLLNVQTSKKNCSTKQNFCTKVFCRVENQKLVLVAFFSPFGSINKHLEHLQSLQFSLAFFKFNWGEKKRIFFKCNPNLGNVGTFFYILIK